MEFIYFLGRFHVLVLHLPIGIIFAAIGIDLWNARKKQQQLKPAAVFLWALSALTAILAVTLGWMHSLENGFDGPDVFKHKWLGISVACGATLIWALRFFKLEFRGEVAYSSTIILLLVFATGHYGGNITHGRTYLVEYAPAVIKRAVGMPEHHHRPKVTELAMADVFLDVVLPALESRCQACHNSGKMKGGFSVGDYDQIMAGGDSGAAIVPGDPLASELLKRITLPESHKDFMPPSGKPPLDDLQVAAIEWWITEGAPKQGLLASSANVETAEILAKILNIDAASQTLARIQPANSDVINSLRNLGFIVRQISHDQNLLEVDGSTRMSKLFTREDADAVCRISEQLSQLNISSLDLSVQSQVIPCPDLPNLKVLNVSKSGIGDQHMAQLPQMPKLETLISHSNALTEDALPHLSNYPKLQKVYLWKNQIDASQMTNLETSTNTGILFGELN